MELFCALGGERAASAGEVGVNGGNGGMEDNSDQQLVVVPVEVAKSETVFSGILFNNIMFV